MNDSEIRKRIEDRFLQAQTPLGRWRLQTQVLWKRCSWKWVVASAFFAKRIFDIVASVILILLLNPLLLFVALLIKLEDGGPVLFFQTRVGKHGTEFKMLKYRSMYTDAEARLKELIAQNQHSDGVTFKIKNDPRVTQVGKWIRKLSIDELPQLFNVLIGNMSLVGPRPPVPREVALYSAADMKRLEATPGITCLWQIGGRSEIDFSGQVQLDLQYIESQSFWGDFKILLKTIPAVIAGKGAY